MKSLQIFEYLCRDINAKKWPSPIHILMLFSFLSTPKICLSTPFFYKQSIFDPHSENCLSFSKKSPPKIV